MCSLFTIKTLHKLQIATGSKSLNEKLKKENIPPKNIFFYQFSGYLKKHNQSQIKNAASVGKREYC